MPKNNSVFVCALSLTVSLFLCLSIANAAEEGLAAYWPMDEGKGNKGISFPHVPILSLRLTTGVYLRRGWGIVNLVARLQFWWLPKGAFFLGFLPPSSPIRGSAFDIARRPPLIVPRLGLREVYKPARNLFPPSWKEERSPSRWGRRGQGGLPQRQSPGPSHM